ncbi:MAG: CoA-binding protein [Chloroflexi bacterium]|nr:CoA-binding protein [Chloroflexota bacterium]
MAHANPSGQAIRQILVEANTIAVVGASSRPDRPSHGVMRRLLAAGYRVIPINPNETEVLGQRAYPSLTAIEKNVGIDIVDVFRRADQTPPVADEAVKVGAKVFWLQLGIFNEDVAARGTAGGLTVVMDSCIAVMHAALQVPAKAQ